MGSPQGSKDKGKDRDTVGTRTSSKGEFGDSQKTLTSLDYKNLCCRGRHHGQPPGEQGQGQGQGHCGDQDLPQVIPQL